MEIDVRHIAKLAMLKIPALEMRRKLKKFFSHPNNRVRANVCIALAKADDIPVGSSSHPERMGADFAWLDVESNWRGVQPWKRSSS